MTFAPSAALEGIRIVDLTSVVFGPYATQTLADYGADVIKIEAPGGDSTRITGASVEVGMAPLFLGSNRNKRSVVLDLKTPHGQAALHALIDTADIFVHNVRPQKLAALGISGEALRARNPRLIYVELLGFGMGGRYAGQPAYDDIIQALSGATDLSDRHMGEVRYLPTIAADKTAAQMAVHAILAALFQRERTGTGQIVQVPMFECMVQFLMTEHYYVRHQQSNGPVGQDDSPQAIDPQELGYPRTLDLGRKPYRTADGHVGLMPYTDQHWHDFFVTIGRADLLQEPRFQTLGARTDNISALLELVEQETVQHSTAHWINVCAGLGIPCTPINRLVDLESDPHLVDVGLFDAMDSGADWTFRFVRSPIVMSASRSTPSMPPRLGEHTQEVLVELGLASPDPSDGTIAVAC